MRLSIAETKKHLFAVSEALAACGEAAREAITLATDFGDLDNADLFTEMPRGIDQQLWLVEPNVSPD